MSAQDNSGPAFPCDVFDGKKHTTSAGMELRDYFAAKAMHAIMATPRPSFGPMSSDDVASLSYQMASAMLKARNQ